MSLLLFELLEVPPKMAAIKKNSLERGNIVMSAGRHALCCRLQGTRQSLLETFKGSERV